MWKFQGSIKKEVEFQGVLKKSSCGISFKGLDFWAWNFQGVSHNFAEFPEVKACFIQIFQGKLEIPDFFKKSISSPPPPPPFPLFGFFLEKPIDGTVWNQLFFLSKYTLRLFIFKFDLNMNHHSYFFLIKTMVNRKNSLQKK